MTLVGALVPHVAAQVGMLDNTQPHEIQCWIENKEHYTMHQKSDTL